MKKLLDANVCARYLNGKVPQLNARLLAHSWDELVVCSVVKAELFAGALKSSQPEQTIFRQEAFFANFVSLPFNDTSAVHFGEIRAHLERAGTPIGPLDLQIAAIALANDLILVTHNTKEFSRVPGLTIEDWEIQ